MARKTVRRDVFEDNREKRAETPRPAPPRADSRASGAAPAARPAAPQARKAAPAPAPAAEPHRRLDPSDLEAIASMSMEELAKLMDESSTRARVDVGTQVTGTITRVGSDNLFVDVGAKSEAMLERIELPDAKIGDVVTAFVLATDENGIHLSKRLSGAAAGAFIAEAAESGVPVEGRVASRNPGGFEVRIGAVRAFCPISQIDRVPDDPEAYVGKIFEFKVLEAGENVVVSRRALLEAGVVERRQKFWEDAKIGDEHDAIVVNVQPFGVFVDMNGVEGLVPKRELSWEENVDLATYKRGQPLKVRIVDLDHEARKITLSSKDQAYSPWQKVGTEIQSGGTYTGTVVRVATFGAFIELAPGLQGLLHNSRAGRGGLPAVGSKVEVRVTGVDHERQRIELAVADLIEQSHAAGTDTIGAVVKGTITQVLKNGLVVELEDGNTGWVPSREIDLPAGTILPQRFRAGREIQGRVLETDPSRRRVTLSLKLEADEESGAWAGHAAGQKGKPQTFGTFAELFSGFKPKK